MKMNPEDPRLTAYALNELEPGERAAVETELKDNSECRAAVEEIRQAAGLLSQELSAEPCPALSPQQRAKIDERLEPANVVPFPHRHWPAMAALAALAACVMFVIAWQLWFAGSGKVKPTTVASVTAQPAQPAPPTVRLGPTVSPAVKTEQADMNSTTVVTFSAPAAEPAKAGESLIKQAQTVTTPADKVEVLSVSPPVNGNAGTSYAIQDSLQPVNPVTVTAPTASPTVTKSAEFAMTLGPNLKNANEVPTGTTPQLAENSASQQAVDSTAVRSRAGGGIVGGGGRGGRRSGAGGGAMGGGGAGGGGFAGGTLIAQNNVVVTESEYRRTVVYDDPTRDVFGAWRYYRYPTPPSFPMETASYPQYPENSFQMVMQHPLSTFSVDVDTASYANVRRFLNAGRLPPKDAVRIEELINYFTYNYPKPKGEDPFAATIEVAGCPWDAAHRLVRVGIKGREIASNKRPPSNFVFLIDISGSMAPRERLPLIKEALRALVKKMGEGDRVAIVVYANEAGVRLASTSCMEKEKILEAIDSLSAGGSTNGGDGIQEAYRVAQENFIAGGVNRVLLCTDGDFNVGITDPNELVRMVQERAKGGVFLTTLGVGTDNYKDALMQKLADKGNGNYHYLDSQEEAQKVLIEQMSGTLVTIAKDVKIQIEFNPARVGGYRLIGYEKRALRNEDFGNDAKDAGEIGAGHTVTALYEIAPPGGEFPGVASGLKYQDGQDAAPSAERLVNKDSKELLTLKLRYKHPEGNQSRLLEFPVTDSGASFGRASADFKFASAVAAFGMLLRDSEHRGSANYETVLELAQEAKGADESGYRSEFINLVKKAQALSPSR